MKTILNDSIGRYFSSLVKTSFILGVCIFLLQFFNFRNFCEGLFECKFSPFFNWEIAIIIHTVISFINFTKDKEIDSVLTGDFRLWSSIIIWTFILVAIAVYVYNSRSFSRANHHDFFTIMLMDSITFIPMIIFAIMNVFFWLRYFHNINKRKFFGKLIVFLDLPFIIPYFVIVLYSYNNQENFDVHTFLAGAATILLLCSNFVTFAYNSFKIDFETYDDQLS